jgi:FixJ family two-component response regulator/AraC-like DNA-binding protein
MAMMQSARSVAAFSSHSDRDRNKPARDHTLSSDSDSPTSYLDEPHRPILWIDDAVEPADPAVRLLTLEGFSVDCAASGTTGLSMLREWSYDALILDLRLPDISGLDVLERLRAMQMQVPVLILTGYGDAESASVAIRLGVRDFRWKPLIGDELITVVRGVMNAEGDSRASEFAGRHAAAPVDEVRRPVFMAAELSTLLSDSADGVTTSDFRRRAVVSLTRAVANQHLDISAFLACAEALRELLTAPETMPPEDVSARLRDLLRRPAPPLTVEHRKVRQAIATLETAVRNHTRVTESDLARELGVDPAHLGRLVRSQTSMGFRQWRSTLALRVAVRELADDDAQVAQIAFGVGYEHPSQLDREFRRMFGISPRAFRRLLKSAR